MKSLISHDVFEVVSFVSQIIVSSHWIISEKYKDGEKKIKARLIAHVIEEDTHNVKKYPTCSRECPQLVFFIVAMMYWKLQSIHITAAFLQGGSFVKKEFLHSPYK